MKQALAMRFFVESTVRLLCGFVLMLAIFRTDWIEAAFGVDPDYRSGWCEWLLFAGLFAYTVALLPTEKQRGRKLGTLRGQ
jgi:hypothetical protein